MGTAKLPRDNANVTMQVFAPTRITAVTTSTWTPNPGDRAFRVASDCTYQIDGTGSAGSLKAGMIVGIVEGLTYKFSVGQNLEVM